MQYLHRAMIVPDAIVATVRSLADSFGPASSGMWTTPLSPTGELPATHWISTGFIGPEFAYMVPEQFWEQDETGAWVQTGSTPGNPQAVYEACTAAGKTVTLEEIEAVYAVVDVTEQEPFAAMGRLGLVLVNTGEMA